MADNGLKNRDLSQAFAEIPSDTTRFGIWEGENDAKRFIKIVESSGNKNQASTLAWIPRSLKEYDFVEQNWAPKADLMRIINGNQFEFFDTPQDCQNAMVEHTQSLLNSPDISQMTQKLDGI
ncbi:MAG: hypothetical protein COB14_02395 [Alphaproteobacteria bacterium]|nr:MAG: hypothetical protein COB14_02395 [Alphaproteobacteria bacterium]